ncbi:DUF4386 domain-containing protein [Planomonospora sp. ID67723]|uniref:DUF4386 domain-containing protein n=1 Tax=Planomonospora sp. ID67723 TaxID=2738134 RepID=UPI0018C41F0F|nr:DUF4386 domain-containing protein [Planomonospora sp. ID67723]MBG0831386.1 DUF4386 domain-containing protein [Planomonospora sp. ID67723]
MSERTIGRAVGALLLLAFVGYGGGSALVESGSGAVGTLSGVLDHQVRISAGALLMLINSVAVAGIGVLAFPVLKSRHEISAYAYLMGRAIEAVMLAAGVVFLLLVVPLAREWADAGAPDASVLEALGRVAKEGNRYSYQIAMIALGITGLLFCRVLLRERLVPAFMALWGLAGYAVFLAGAIAEVLGYGIGLALSVPGGLFEVALGVMLIARGFPAGRSLDRDGPAGDASPALR